MAIKTPEEYLKAIAEMSRLTDEIQAYDEANSSIGKPTLEDAIQFRIEQEAPQLGRFKLHEAIGLLQGLYEILTSVEQFGDLDHVLDGSELDMVGETLCHIRKELWPNHA